MSYVKLEPLSLLNRRFYTNKKAGQKASFFIGRRTVTAIEPILSTLHVLLLNYSNIRRRLEKLHSLVNDFAYSERASGMQFLL